MTAKFNKTEYGILLTKTLPKVISSEAELEERTEEVNLLMTKGIKQGGLSPEEENLLELLSILIEFY